MTTQRETELERQLSHIVKECEASSTQSKRIQRIKARAEAAINGSDPDFKSVGDRRDDKIAHIGQLNMMNAQLQSTIAALEAEVMRLRNALETFIAEHEECEDADGWMAQTCSMEALHVADEVMSTPFTPTALPEIIEKVEKMTIERCARESERSHSREQSAYLIRALPTGQIKLGELL